MTLSESPGLLAGEGFIRRAAALNLPFMLKGSFLTRQYFANPNDRIPADLDWVCLQDVRDASEARAILDPWARAVTETELNDGVSFRSFRENAFWRMVEYAMSDDFPTVNTDLAYRIAGASYIEMHMDVSLNLDVAQGPVPLLYRPVKGDAFLVEKTVPLALQIAWKIHQTLVRPRFKDLFDLGHLLRHPSFDRQGLSQMLQALVNECHAGKVNMQALTYFLSKDFSKLFPGNSIENNWKFFRHHWSPKNYSNLGILAFDRAEEITDASKLPEELPDFLEQFHRTLGQAGLTPEIQNDLPISTKSADVIQPPNILVHQEAATGTSHFKNLFAFLRKVK